MATMAELVVAGDGGTALAWTPLADVIETSDAYLVEVHVPASGATTSPWRSPATS
jgi:hypothetical protein